MQAWDFHSPVGIVFALPRGPPKASYTRATLPRNVTPYRASVDRTRDRVTQRFSNFFQVGTTFISQNVLRTTLLLGLSNSLGLP